MKQQVWKDYEKLAAAIQQSLTPNSRVKWNDRVYGHISKKNRQVDVTVHIDLPPYRLLIAIDCKAYRNRVDVKDVEQSIGLFRDIQANKGVIVSNSGFTDGAQRVAVEAGIELLSVIDAERRDWNRALTFPILCEVRRLKSVTTHEFDTSDPVVDDAIYTAEQVVEQCYGLWNAALLPTEPGTYAATAYTNHPLRLLNLDDGVVRTRYVVFTTDVERYYRLVMAPIVKVRGFQNEITGNVASDEYEIQLPELMDEIRNGLPIADPGAFSYPPIPKINEGSVKVHLVMLETHHTRPELESPDDPRHLVLGIKHDFGSRPNQP